MASMSYCRWQNVCEDLRDAMAAFYNGNPLNNDEKAAMKGCCELFVELLQYGHISDEGYKEVDLALMDVYTEIDERHDDDDDEYDDDDDEYDTGADDGE